MILVGEREITGLIFGEMEPDREQAIYSEFEDNFIDSGRRRRPCGVNGDAYRFTR